MQYRQVRSDHRACCLPFSLTCDASFGLVDRDVPWHDRIGRMSRRKAGVDDPFAASAVQGEGQNG